MADLIEVEGLTAGYGNAVVLDDVSFALSATGSLALLGRNGVGKTTLLVTLMGLTQVSRGRMHFDGREIAAVPSYARARMGLGWVPQERFIFPSLTIEENLAVVARRGAWNIERVYELFPRLEERRSNFGNQLSGGEQQMLAIGRALVTNPRVLLLDEPMEGLAPLIVQELVRVIRELIEQGHFAVIIVEQHARIALSVTREALVLDRGRVVYYGESAALLKDPQRLDSLVSVA